ncbi:ABC transporter transmembrane domain-containing protein [Phaeobacter porticola]|uniref:Putative cyclic nucleotide-binding ABC transporter transmembrane protein n=1 Tax=Phaeobacter porticola TaxID=1844006 RepID=A0A1L3I0R6_9RHOB|nr:ABC transporter transmembrane domain-containing protein [Phaeobacter porticola]APG45567.1 putative cyclic nucleotide-binding ABC transporter transmembrane protein [Phaeobacter porticola]
MKSTLFSFIWTYSRRQQIGLLALTVVTFPFLFAALELPKRIINDAIGAPMDRIVVLGQEIGQVDYLLLLCCGFLAAVMISGLLKMRLNTMKGVVAERLLRRLRYTLISRMMRFPTPYFRTTSQGEMVSMITSESEPMGGLMGDAVAQPVFQAGQMLTIVTFLFMQSVWFGLASVALIPLQAWLIPMLQRQINLLNKDRIQEVRALSAEIGETAAGISDLRINGGRRYRLAQISARLGRLFDIRRRIYSKKYFMKFLNNMIGHLTPFVFYSAGGVLAIRGDITVGALVAALAAYKDLSAPWRELLTYYNQVQDMSLRWSIMTERFAPKGMIAEELIVGTPADIPHLRGAIELRNVSVKDADGNMVLEDLSLAIPAGGRVAIQSSSEAERAAFAALLTREVLPARGSVTIAGHRLDQLHQGVIAARVGYAYSRPYLFNGSLGDNVLMSLRDQPHMPPGAETRGQSRTMTEACRAGNSPDSLAADWINPALAGLGSESELRDWWFQLVEAMGIDEQLFRRTLHTRFQIGPHLGLVQQIVSLRPKIAERLQQAGLADVVNRFDPDVFNPAVPLGGNILFAAPTRAIAPEELIAADGPIVSALRNNGLQDDVIAFGLSVMETLQQTFGRVDTNHPLFKRLGLDEALYQRIAEVADRQATLGVAGLREDERVLLASVPFLISEEQIGTPFPERFKRRILDIRRDSGPALQAQLGDLFIPITPDAYFPRLTVLENVLYGRLSLMAGAKAKQVEDLVAEVLEENGLRKRLALILYDLPAGLGGTALEPVFQERAAFTRAAIKRPDILILDRALASHDSASRLQSRDRLAKLMPHATMLFIEDQFNHPDRYDLFVKISNGRIDGVEGELTEPTEKIAGSDLGKRLELIQSTELFAQLDARNQRLLAFSARWHDVVKGDYVFQSGESADAVFLCLSGKADLFWPGSDLNANPISQIEPGRLIGDLAVILRDTRQLDLFAVEDCSFLRIGAEEYRAVIESDSGVAVQLLETVARHLVQTAGVARAAKQNVADSDRLSMAAALPDTMEQADNVH